MSSLRKWIDGQALCVETHYVYERDPEPDRPGWLTSKARFVRHHYTRTPDGFGDFMVPDHWRMPIGCYAIVMSGSTRIGPRQRVWRDLESALEAAAKIEGGTCCAVRVLACPDERVARHADISGSWPVVRVIV